MVMVIWNITPQYPADFSNDVPVFLHLLPTAASNQEHKLAKEDNVKPAVHLDCIDYLALYPSLYPC